MTVDLRLGDCLDLLPSIASESIDFILTDLPYGTTNAAWDVMIDPASLWKEFNRVIKRNGCIALFAMYPFSIDLIQPARRLFRYEWVWQKHMPVGFLNANRMPLRTHESILVFYKHLPTYHPQKWQSKPYRKSVSKSKSSLLGAYGDSAAVSADGLRYPLDVIRFSNDISAAKRTHPTEKPVDLLEYFIKTYTNEGDTVLDCAMGTGATGVAAMNLRRDFIGMELNETFFGIATERIKAVKDGII